MAKHKHLTMNERMFIAECLQENKSFKAIGSELMKDATTIAKEVKKHITIRQVGCCGKTYNNCKKKLHCTESYLCKECTFPKAIKRCCFCNRCNHICKKYESQRCLKREKPPYVCNGCHIKHNKCTLEKHLYIPIEAHNEYVLSLHESRTGIEMTEQQIEQLDALFSPLLKQKQSIHHICITHRDSVMVSESTIYRLVDSCFFQARNLDLPRKVRFAKRKKQKPFKVDKSCRIGRTFEDYLSYLKSHPDIPVTQIDTVEGKKGGKVLLTIHFVNAECMLAFLRDRNDSQSVIDIIDCLYQKLGADVFSNRIPLLLGDNGSEFSNPLALEFDRQGTRRTRVFYCDPSAPWQKGSCERNHEFLRMFIPKGTSLNSYTQTDIDRMIDHINSYKRPSLGDKSPYEMLSFLYGKDFLSRLGCRPVSSDFITLNPSIFKKEGDPCVSL